MEESHECIWPSGLPKPFMPRPRFERRDATEHRRCILEDESDLHAPFYLWLHELFTRLLTEAVEREELAPLDALYTADAILATLHPMFYRFQRQERSFSPERILQGLRHIYIDGVKSARVTAGIAGTEKKPLIDYYVKV